MKFVCPNCQIRNISFGKKWRSGVMIPVKCESCNALQFSDPRWSALYGGIEGILIVVSFLLLFLYFEWRLGVLLFLSSILALELVRVICIPLVLKEDSG